MSSGPDTGAVSAPQARAFTPQTNASLATVAAGFKAAFRCAAKDGTIYYRFHNGQLRREIGEGHSAAERAARRDRRNEDYRSRREYKRGRAEEMSL